MQLSTHVLDVARGVPAEGVAVRLFRIEGRTRTELAGGSTNADGRIASPFGGELEAGWYELTFDAGAYYARRGEASFYDEVPVRFRIDAGGGRYHVPLLLSPWGYSTYRGS